jgi:hypothetical protein
MLRSADRGPEAKAAATRAAALGDGALGRIRLAALALDAKDVPAALKLLSETRAASSNLPPDLRSEVEALWAFFEIANGNADAAAKALDAAGTFDGPYGTQLVDILRSSRRVPEAVGLAERLLRSARLGGSVGASHVAMIYGALAKLNDDRPDARLAELVRTLPPPDAGFPELPRLATLAIMAERLGRPAEALAAARAARDKGLVDVGVQIVEWRALLALGDLDAAERVAAKLERLSPGAFRIAPSLGIDAAAAPPPGRP